MRPSGLLGADSLRSRRAARRTRPARDAPCGYRARARSRHARAPAARRSLPGAAPAAVRGERTTAHVRERSTWPRPLTLRPPRARARSGGAMSANEGEEVKKEQPAALELSDATVAEIEKDVTCFAKARSPRGCGSPARGTAEVEAEARARGRGRGRRRWRCAARAALAALRRACASASASAPACASQRKSALLLLRCVRCAGADAACGGRRTEANKAPAEAEKAQPQGEVLATPPGGVTMNPLAE